ncbi:MAG: oleate hydratase [Ignavibacteriales bacterium]|nr:oleate hydratase [Ignavibacteriales bacterium]
MYDSIIIGGGLSGLAATVKLAGVGKKIVLIEQAPRLGGRCYSFVDKTTGDVVDNGQHLLVGAYHNLLDYLDLIGTRHLVSYQERSKVVFFDAMKGQSEFLLKELPRPFNLLLGLFDYKHLRPIDRFKLLRVGVAINNWTSSTERRLEKQNIDEWLTSLGQSENALKYFWHPIAVSIMNESPKIASALLFARALRSTFLGSKNDSAILTPKVGQSELYSEPAIRFLKNHGAVIFLNRQVVSLFLKEGEIKGVITRDGETLEAESVVSAVTNYALSEIIPEEWRKEKPFCDIGKIQNSPIVSVNLWYEKDFMDLDSIGLIDRNFHWFFNRRRIITSKNQTGYISGVISAAHDYVDLANDEIIKLALKDIQLIYPQSKNIKVIDSLVIREKRATISASVDIEHIRPETESKIKRFFIAGDWTNTGLPATIEGAVMSGFKAANKVLALSGNQ